MSAETLDEYVKNQVAEGVEVHLAVKRWCLLNKMDKEKEENIISQGHNVGSWISIPKKGLVNYSAIIISFTTEGVLVKIFDPNEGFLIKFMMVPVEYFIKT